MAKLALFPSHPERVCWGCDKYCPADSLTCGNGTERTPHPIELFGPDWVEPVDEEPDEAQNKDNGTVSSAVPPEPGRSF